MDSTAPSEKNGVIKGNDEEEVNLEVCVSVFSLSLLRCRLIQPRRRIYIPRVVC